ncbi:MAG: SDR family NAD(P)-dependent oxidoreductase, partial [Proteobacteria bacterium]|nr:SDR family NAD(P)-dependent oxidoreductase [Pseudomonadota bacterium]
MNNSTPLCVVTGVGNGTGASIVKRFAASNYRVAMIARNETRLRNISNEIDNTYAYTCDVGEIDNLTRTIKSIQQELGNPEVLIHNAVAASFQNFLESDPDDLEKNFRVNTTSL